MPEKGAMKSYLVAIAAVGVITAAIVGGVLWNESKTSKRLSAEARAVGLTALAEEWYDSIEEENVSGHTVTFSYVDAANGVHTEKLERITWFDPSKQYKVCYDPAQPADWKLYEASHVCGS